MPRDVPRPAGDLGGCNCLPRRQLPRVLTTTWLPPRATCVRSLQADAMCRGRASDDPKRDAPHCHPGRRSEADGDETRRARRTLTLALASQRGTWPRRAARYAAASARRATSSFSRMSDT